MPISKAQTQITWGGAVTSNITAGSSGTSDAVTVADNATAASVMVKVAPAGAAAAGDYVEVKVLLSAGDPDADPDSADEFETASGALLTRYVDISGGTGVTVFSVNPSVKALQVYVRNAAATVAVDASAQLSIQTFSET